MQGSLTAIRITAFFFLPIPVSPQFLPLVPWDTLEKERKKDNDEDDQLKVLYKNNNSNKIFAYMDIIPHNIYHVYYKL